ncbi:MAG: hypothetical protein ACD_42C00446G0001 [uncultured bacterium]|nr:MAG: hypothetical protein ACD_42C00446G0001 [uncultured bacterium]OGT33509.1 MAG: hypothetical protein A3C44_01260 [Gammaproteobacteria bacterium RIFCSPHIGHO2_02_FULL_39_13]OGT49524.1 MAG: hypothetical protein A3E53_00005 [Gammaproteobacteria bacterium RIFCSPHIGHO2_12_FULL_39_24]
MSRNPSASATSTPSAVVSVTCSCCEVICESCIIILEKSLSSSSPHNHESARAWQENYKQFLELMKLNPAIANYLKQMQVIAEIKKTTESAKIQLTDFQCVLEQNPTEHIIIGNAPNAYRQGNNTLRCLAAAYLMRSSLFINEKTAIRFFDVLQEYVKQELI